MSGTHDLQSCSDQVKAPEVDGVPISHPYIIQEFKEQSLDSFNICLPLAPHKGREFEE